MRSFYLTGALVASLAATSAVAAGPFQVQGTPAFDRSTSTLYVNGEDFYVPENVGTAKLRGADTVTVEWTQQGDRRVVEHYSADREDD